MSHDDTKLRVEQEIFLRSFFDEPPPDRMARQLVARMEDGHYRRGELLFERGEQSTRFFFVVDGEVVMESPDSAPWHFGPNSMIGVADAVLERPRARSARAETYVQTLSINLDDYAECLEDNYEFAKSAMQRACRTVHDQGRQLAPDDVFAERDLEAPKSGLRVPNRRLNSVERLLALRTVPLFQDTAVQPIVTLAQHAYEERWEPGALLFRRGDAALYLYVVVAGHFSVMSESPEIRGVFGPGSILGGPGMLGHEESLYRIQAKCEAITLRIAKEDLFDVIEDHYIMSRSIFQWVARENERTRVALGRRTEDVETAA